MSEPTEATKKTRRLPPPDNTPAEKRTIRQVQDAQRAHQAHIGLESAVREFARELGLDASTANDLAKSAWGGFRIVNGEPIPVESDKQTVLLDADHQNVLSVREWTARKVRALKSEGGGQRGPDGRWQKADGSWDADGEEVLPRANPFRRKTWNLTEQMRLQRRDPKLARRLKAEAVANGEN